MKTKPAQTLARHTGISVPEIPVRMRRRHFYALGYSREEVAKLIAAGVLTPIRVRKAQRAYFDRDKSLEALKHDGN